jgi:hypothetical protein
MTGGLVLAGADRSKRARTDLADDPIPTTHAQTARESFAALRGRTRRRTDWSFSTHCGDPLDTVDYPYIIAGVWRQEPPGAPGSSLDVG